MSRRVVATVVAAAVLGGTLLAAPTGAGAQSAPPPPESTDGGVRADLVALYGSMQAVVEHGAAAGAPVNVADPPATPEAFERQLALVSDEDLAPFAAVFERTSIVEDFEELAASTAPGTEASSAPSGATGSAPTAAAAAAPAVSTSAFAVVVPPPPDIPPPPPPFVPSSPVVLTETLTCPDIPPGPDWGSFAIFEAKVAASAIGAVAEALPDEIQIVIPIIAGVALTFTLPNPLKIIAQTAKGIAEEAVLTLEWLKDRYGDCGGVDLFAAGPNIENTAIQLYGITSRANDVINDVNRGLIAVSDQVAVLQASQEELQTVRIQQALAAPTTSAPNVAYVLPASEGGYLDASPVGVRGVVEQTLAAARAAGLPVNAVTIIYKAQADVMLAARSYANAYRLYQRTYQAIGR